MEQDWRINKTRTFEDDFSTAELLFDKQRTGPPFVFRETNTMFILTAILKGYKINNLKVEIDKGGKRVAIIGEKSVQATTMMGNTVYTKEVEMRGFKRAFHFSDGVLFDEIKARFDEQEFLLTISIPKMERGFRVTRVEEVKQEEIGGTYESLQIEEKKVDEIETSENDKYREEVKEENARDKDVVMVNKEELEEKEVVQVHNQTRINPVETFKDRGLEGKQESVNTNVAELDQTRGFEEKEKNKRMENESEGTKRDDNLKKNNKCKLCNPVILGSTIIVTISVLVIYLVRNQNPHRKRKN